MGIIASLGLDPSDRLGCAANAGLLGAWGAAAVILGGQSLHWLRYGTWPPVNIGTLLAHIGLEPAKLNWVGAQTVVDLWFGLPLTLVLAFGTPILILFLAQMFWNFTD